MSQETAITEIVWDPSQSEDVVHPVLRSEVIGHSTASADFIEAWHAGRLPHALLLAGPKGIGKATLAYAMAKFLLHHGQPDQEAGLFGPTPAPETLDVPAESPAVRRLIAGSHADFLPVVRVRDTKTKKLRKEIGVDEVRAVTSFMRQTAGEGAWRVVIVDAADEMNRNAANALLKILEEPPASTFIILVAHRPGRLLPTIRSRCHKVDLRPLTDDQMTTVLGDQMTTNDPEFTRLSLALAEGSPGRVLAYLDPAAQKVMAGFMGHVTQLPKLDIPAAYQYAELVAKQEHSGRVFQDMTRWWLHRVASGYSLGDRLVPVYDQEKSLLARFMTVVPLDRWLAVWDKASHIFDRADRVNLDPKQVVMSVLMEMADAAKG